MNHIDIIDKYELQKEFSDIRNNIKGYKFDDKKFYVKINLIDSYFAIPFPDLERFYTEADLKLKDFEYLESYGIRYKNYFEISIVVNPLSPKNYYYVNQEPFSWDIHPLKFKIADTQYEISEISKLMIFLVAPLYDENNFGYYIDSDLVSLKIALGKGKSYKEEFIKGLFYLNSFY